MRRGWLALLLAAFVGTTHAAYLTPTVSGDLMIQYLWGEAGPSHQEFGTYDPVTGKTKTALQVDYTKPAVTIPVANLGYHWAGVGIDFYERSDYGGDLAAFSNGSTPSDLTAFTDTNNSGSAIEVVGANDWILHLDDAWSFMFDDDDNELVLRVWIDPSAPVPVPEPGSLALGLLGMIALTLNGKRSSHKHFLVAYK